MSTMIFDPPYIMLFEEMMQTVAFKSLGKNALHLLLYSFKNKRIDKKKTKQNKKGNSIFFINNSFPLTYSGIKKNFGWHNQQIVKAIDELLAKGFIKIIEQGGSYKGKHSLYKFSDKYMEWKKGEIVFKRKKDAHRGFQGKNNENLKRK